MVGRDGIEPPTPGFSVLWSSWSHRAPSAGIGQNSGSSVQAESVISTDDSRFRSMVLTQLW